MSGSFDCFFSHNSADKPLVRELDRLVRERGVETWLDQREIKAGDSWLPLLEQGIRESHCAAVLLGPSGLGPWHGEETQVLLVQATARGKRVIPVLLPGFDGAIPAFLDLRSRIDLTAGIGGPELEQLVAAIQDPPSPAVVPCS